MLEDLVSMLDVTLTAGWNEIEWNNRSKLFRTKGIILDRIKSNFDPIWLGSDLV